MLHSMRGPRCPPIRGACLLALVLGSFAFACAPVRPPAPLVGSASLGAGSRSVTLRSVDHLAFGARLESVSVAIDGAPAVEGASLSVEPGGHTLSLVARASEPCGFLEEPRTSVTIEATTTFRVGEGSGSILADLYSREATSDPIRSLSVRFKGDNAVLGAPANPRSLAAGCTEGDALCAIDVLVARARTRGDLLPMACYESKRAEARSVRDILEDSYGTVAREGATAGEAESAQLRARYAKARLRSLALEAEGCTDFAPSARVSATVERRVERACPVPDVTAGL